MTVWRDLFRHSLGSAMRMGGGAPSRALAAVGGG